MQRYTVNIFTTYSPGTFSKWLFIKLFGKDGESGWTWCSGVRGLFNGGNYTLTVTCDRPLGDLDGIELQKRQLLPFRDLEWFIEKVEVTSPEGKVFKFPVYHWIKKTHEYGFCEGKALKFRDRYPKIQYTRVKQLEWREKKYSWGEYEDYFPHVMKIEKKGIFSLPSEVQFSLTKSADFAITAAPQLVKDTLFSCCQVSKPWKNLEDIYGELRNHMTDKSEYVYKHWKEDSFFGYQFLNGVNPMKIELCTCLPDNFPVPDDIKLDGDMKLSDEIKNKNIFICNYETLNGVEAGVVREGQKVLKEYLAAPLVLFHKTHHDELKPVAIQLKQTPATNNPIFYPTDSEHDWLLAKTYVRSADFAEHQLNTHLLRTHLLSEVFSVSLMRNVLKVHPLYKLLIPHTRYTLQINQLARELLISENGVFPTFSATTKNGMTTILQRSMSRVTYRSLCIKDNIEQRGLNSMPNYYYRDDGFKLWDIIEKFVKAVLSYYYKSDEEIKQDPELQSYIKDIFEHGFLSNGESGIPQSFETVDDLVKFATMVIFTASAQHAAVNNGQYDYGTWMPNTPTTLMKPPPETKGETCVKKEGEEVCAHLLETLPGRYVTHKAVSVLHLLSKPSPDFVALGEFPNENFTEMFPRERMDEFHHELMQLDEEIYYRNKTLELPYIYLKPSLMENSVSI